MPFEAQKVGHRFEGAFITSIDTNMNTCKLRGTFHTLATQVNAVFTGDRITLKTTTFLCHFSPAGAFLLYHVDALRATSTTVDRHARTTIGMLG